MLKEEEFLDKVEETIQDLAVYLKKYRSETYENRENLLALVTSTAERLFADIVYYKIIREFEERKELITSEMEKKARRGVE